MILTRESITTRAWWRLLVGTALCGVLSLVFLGATQNPASARAEVVSSSPANGATVRTAPKEVFIRFSEEVSFRFGGVTVVDEKGDAVDDGNPGHGDTKDIIQVGLIDGLGDGTYVVNYRVTSQDGQPITGAVLFTVGQQADTGGSTGGTVDDTTVLDRQITTDKALHIIAGIFRFITYTAALLAAGLAGFLAFVHDQSGDRWKLAQPIRVGSLVAAFGSVGTVVMETALLSGRGISGAADTSLMREVLSDGLGWSTAILLTGLALVHLSTDTNRLIVAQTLSFYGVLMVTVSFALAGHSYSADNQSVAIISDAIHVTASAVWFGGLVGLVATLTMRRRALRNRSVNSSGDVPSARSTAGILGRFSMVAAVSLVALVVSGAVVASTQLPGPSSLFSSTYGRLLAIKVGLVAVACLLAAYNRFALLPAVLESTRGAGVADTGDSSTDAVVTTGASVDPVSDQPGDAEHPAWQRITSAVRLEAICLVVVLVVTSILVAVDPPRAPRKGPQIFNEWADLSRGGRVSMNINPNRVGQNTIHIQYYDASGRPDRNVTDAQIEFLLPQNGIGPIERKALRGGSGHFIYQGTELSIDGEWQVNVLAQITQFDQERTYFEVDVSK